MVSTQPDLERLGKSLIALANERGGPDNITVVLARFEGEGLQPADEAGLEYHQYPTSAEQEEAALPPVESVRAPVATPRLGSPIGMALLVVGSIVVLLALFFALV